MPRETTEEGWPAGAWGVLRAPHYPGAVSLYFGPTLDMLNLDREQIWAMFQAITLPMEPEEGHNVSPLG